MQTIGNKFYHERFCFNPQLYEKMNNKHFHKYGTKVQIYLSLIEIKDSVKKSIKLLKHTQYDLHAWLPTQFIRQS